MEFTGLSLQLHIGSNDLMEMEMDLRQFNPFHIFLTNFFQFEAWLCDMESRQAMACSLLVKLV